VVLPQLTGAAYRRLEEIGKIPVPVLAITSEFGTVSMWDWEIISVLRAAGARIFAPYTPGLARALCRSLALRREMREARFLVFQDTPGEGMQALIFKRFYWWEETCARRMKEKFGVTVEKRSYRELAEKAKRFPDAQAQEVSRAWSIPCAGVSARGMNSAAKLYLALREELGKVANVRGAGTNCLNESFYSDTTPCLAWDRLFEEQGLLWACEADLLSLMTEYLVHGSLNAPVLTSNVYPFLVGLAALKHEHLERFPDVPEPENCLLVAHCGYFGLAPRAFAAEWTLRPKVLAIVDDNATAVDARFPPGPVTLVKLDAAMERLLVIEGEIERYVQYPESHCRNGGVIRVRDGRELMNRFCSHHLCFVPGDHRAEIENLCRVFDLEPDRMAK
jgi:L-fucose isomerase-like protein